MQFQLLTTIVLVATSKQLSVLGHNTRHLNLALGLSRLAVTARPPQFAKVLNVEVLDDDLSTTVVLDDLVVGVLGASSGDVRGAGALLDGQSILADIFPPDVLDGAASETVDTLNLVLADDDVFKSGASFEDEDGVLVATFGLARAGDWWVC